MRKGGPEPNCEDQCVGMGEGGMLRWSQGLEELAGGGGGVKEAPGENKGAAVSMSHCLGSVPALWWRLLLDWGRW